MREFVMPKLGLTMDEGTIIRWLKNEGQSFVNREAIVEIESDKAVVEIEAPFEGKIGKILVNSKNTVRVGEVIAYLLEKDEPLRDIWPVVEKTNNSSSTLMTESISNNAPHDMDLATLQFEKSSVRTKNNWT